MKVFSAAIILIILCFNWFGYTVVINFLQQRSDVQMEAMLDKKSMKEADLFEIMIPLHLPYQTSWADYERYDGEVKLDGTIYKYVKRKLVDDTLHLICIKNTNKMEYENVKSDFYKHTNDISSNRSTPKSTSVLIRKLMIDFDNFSLCFNTTNCTKLVQKRYLTFTESNTTDAFIVSPKQPPDGILA